LNTWISSLLLISAFIFPLLLNKAGQLFKEYKKIEQMGKQRTFGKISDFISLFTLMQCDSTTCVETSLFSIGLLIWKSVNCECTDV